jgi:hypothetical protein
MTPHVVAVVADADLIRSLAAEAEGERGHGH